MIYIICKVYKKGEVREIFFFGSGIDVYSFFLVIYMNIFGGEFSFVVFEVGLF